MHLGGKVGTCMKDVIATRLSSKGRVENPDAVRRRPSREPGPERVVLAEDDAIVLKRIGTPAMRDFDTIVANARQAARRAGLRRSDVATAIETARST